MKGNGHFSIWNMRLQRAYPICLTSEGVESRCLAMVTQIVLIEERGHEWHK